jgi:hypothetical protein
VFTFGMGENSPFKRTLAKHRPTVGIDWTGKPVRIMPNSVLPIMNKPWGLLINACKPLHSQAPWT